MRAWGYSPSKGVPGCAALKTPFSRSFTDQFPKTAISTCFSSVTPPFPQKSQFFTKICRSTAEIYPKFLFQSVKSGQIQFFKPYIIQKIQFFKKKKKKKKKKFFKPLVLVPTRPLSPHFIRGPSGRISHIYNKMKVEYPPGMLVAY